jgi:hypothetical protein
MGQPPPPLPPPNFFYPSPIGSAALTSPVSNGAFPSLAPSEYLEEESAMDELWTEADMMGEEEGLVPGMDPQQGMAAGSGQGRKKSKQGEGRASTDSILSAQNRTTNGAQPDREEIPLLHQRPDQPAEGDAGLGRDLPGMGQRGMGGKTIDE